MNRFFIFFIYIFKLDRQTNRAQMPQLLIVTIMFNRTVAGKLLKQEHSQFTVI